MQAPVMGRVKVPLNKKIEIKTLLEFGIAQRRIATDLDVLKKMCLQRLKEAQGKFICEWNNIIWSDEAHFEVLNRKNRTFVRRLRSEADQPFNFVPKVQDGGGSISVWECMASGARGPLVTYSGKVDGRAYVKIIEEALPSFIENAFDSSNKNWMFMRDNAPPHRSKYTMKWLQDKGIKVMEWPVTSPRS
ncbi:unnamed protein product [Rotaria socialis]|uniref:Transposase n=1 Tax=Rotaria socialis TaxID=392032 RepID=A0A821BVS5_9BILA|nr:unnamed protein product [Rotaria socialis]CAF4769576.1 unnamed protein product [Rotaria socialis]